MSPRRSKVSLFAERVRHRIALKNLALLITAGSVIGHLINYVFRTNVGSSTNLSPVLHVRFDRNSERVSDNRLLDTGSGLTYLSREVLKSLSTLELVGLDCNFSLSSLLQEIVLDTDAVNRSHSLPVLFDKNIDFSVHIKALDSLLDRLQSI